MTSVNPARPSSRAPRQDAAAYRERLAAGIVAALVDDRSVRAIGEGGAAARGRADAYSDLDLVIVAALERAEAVYTRVEAALREVAPVTHVWSVEPPTFAGTAQRFYFLDGAPRFFAVDCTVFAPDSIEPFLERERHGELVVWHDRDGLLKPRRINRAQWKQRRSARLAQLRGAVPVYALLLDKELARGHALEALGFHQVLLRALIEVLGMRHRPDRFDFGWRYVQSELPPEAQALIARHAFVADAAALPRIARALVNELKAQLDAAG